jgi:hypothetical protein
MMIVELVNLIRYAPKPRTMGVGLYFYCLRDLNEQVIWLPGNKVKLTAKQLDQAFHDAMPQSWQDRYSYAGRSIITDNHANIHRFFCIQQATAARSRNNNVVKQKKTRNGDQPAHPVRFAAGARRNLKFRRGGDGKRESGVLKSKPEAKRISDETKCPVHPNGNHAWNVANKDKEKPAAVPSKSKGKPKSAVVDTNAMQCDDDESLMELSGNEVINDPLDQESVASDDIHGLCAQLNEQPDDPQDLVNKFKNRKSDQSEGTFDTFVNTIEPFTHHLNELSLLAMQESTTNVLCDDEFIDIFMQYCNDAYSAGVSDNNSSIVPDLDSILHLCTTSYAIVKGMQHSKVDCMLRVLFDSGSDKTLLKKSVLLKGINPSQGKKCKVTGVISSAIMDCEILIELFQSFCPHSVSQDLLYSCYYYG